MSNIVRFKSMKPINMDHIMTFELDVRQIRFFPAHPNQFAQSWKFGSPEDARRVYEKLLETCTNDLSVLHVEGNYEY